MPEYNSFNVVLQQKLDKWLNAIPQAWPFLNAYGKLCHMVDDIVDHDNPGVADYKRLVLDSFGLALEIYSSPFYIQNIGLLYPICKHLHRVYVDSVLWETSDVAWKRQYADNLRCCGGELIVAILDHLCRCPANELTEISLLLREEGYIKHHDKEGKAV